MTLLRTNIVARSADPRHFARIQSLQLFILRTPTRRNLAARNSAMVSQDSEIALEPWREGASQHERLAEHRIPETFEAIHIYN